MEEFVKEEYGIEIEVVERIFGELEKLNLDNLVVFNKYWQWFLNKIKK